MKKLLCGFLACMLVMSSFLVPALADRMYLIPDSDKREVTAEELWGWDYESLGYILNEIFARHGYVFASGGKYEYYFKCMPWYTPNQDANNDRACYPKLNKTEWANVNLVKAVREEMRKQNTLNKGAKSVWDGFSTGFDVLQGFDNLQFAQTQNLPVYSAPGAASWRGANGKASISTNGAVYAAGVDNGWLMVMYETNNKAVRVGYIDCAKVTGKVKGDAWGRALSFANLQAEVVAPCSLTDDPATQSANVKSLKAGDQVIYLSTFYNFAAWDYVETKTADGLTVRGFIPAGCLNYGAAELDEIGNGGEG